VFFEGGEEGEAAGAHGLLKGGDVRFEPAGGAEEGGEHGNGEGTTPLGRDVGETVIGIRMPTGRAERGVSSG
jgi:hypothetical protein